MMKEIILTTTNRISKSTIEKICDGLKKKFGTDDMICRTDNSIIGGFTVRYDGKFYDMSIASQIDSIRRSVENTEDAK